MDTHGCTTDAAYTNRRGLEKHKCIMAKVVYQSQLKYFFRYMEADRAHEHLKLSLSEKFYPKSILV
jgi:hypothetical protein